MICCRWAMGLVLCGVVWLSCPATVWAQPAGEQVQDERSLQDIQRSISARYQRFSKTLAQLHGYMKESDPARAELLMRVIGKSNEARIDSQLEMILDLLSEENPQYGGIVERQESLIGALLTLLDVLQSEDEHKRLQDEIARIEALIGDLNNLIVEQKEIRAGTERGRAEEGLQKNQQGLTDKTQNLADKIDQQDRERQADREGNDGEQSPEKSGSSEPSKPEPSEGDKNSDSADSMNKEGEKSESGKPDESKPESENSEGMPGDAEKSQDSGEQSPGEKSSGQSSPSQGKPMPGQPGGEPSEGDSESSSGEQSESDPAAQEQTAGREEIESAIEKMQRAIEELKEKNRDKASREQDRAIAELEKAKARLEEILRQFREEEQKIMLAALEARFRKMLTMQVSVRKSTGQLQDVAVEARLPRHRARSTQLARDQREIVLEADKVLILLREEGTSVAFPEAVTQLRDDMQTVAERLNGFQIDELTVAIEDDVIEALEEMLEALRKEMEKLEQKQQQQQQQQQQQEADQELIDLIGELKLLRSLQYRVNRRTMQLGRDVDGEQATDAEMRKLLNQLAERQARIQRATYDLSVGRNR